ncbi:MAG: hypothetical protein Q4A49_00550 [Neisseria sp.]|nr:hypothetical protein [Neisseria sp.]
MWRNKFTLLTLVWASLTIYALLRRDLGSSPLPFADMLTVSCAALSLGQSVLSGKSMISKGKPLSFLPVCGMSAAWVLLWRLIREYAFALPSASMAATDAAACLLGAAAALFWLKRTEVAPSA